MPPSRPVSSGSAISTAVGRCEITLNLGAAVNRLGMAYTANLATGLATEQMFQATTDMIDKRTRSVWQNSTEVAGIAQCPGPTLLEGQSRIRQRLQA